MCCYGLVGFDLSLGFLPLDLVLWDTLRFDMWFVCVCCFRFGWLSSGVACGLIVGGLCL